MDLKCPSCKREFDIGNAAAPRENMICPFCETVLFRAGDIAFMYGKNVPDRGDGKRRISCPYCQQKYVITDIPYHGLMSDLSEYFFCPETLSDETFGTEDQDFPSVFRQTFTGTGYAYCCRF